MLSQIYKKQARLLLKVIPEVAKESCFALHGGTAINLFIRNMPRLSVDIDLTYIPIEDRNTSLKNISDALNRIKYNIEKVVDDVEVQHRQDVGKLTITAEETAIKVEVNLVGRGIIAETIMKTLCENAQVEFDAFAAIPIVPIGQLYGGKICAALDRQHPRDLFDIKYLLENDGISDEIKRGLIYGLSCHDRPIHEIIHPNYQDQRVAMANQFNGMSIEEFTYDEYETTRERLVKIIDESLTLVDKQFLLALHDVEPDWSTYDFKDFPTIKWKLKNLEILKNNNRPKHRAQYEALKKKLQL